jgi:hypothetical protein
MNARGGVPRWLERIVDHSYLILCLGLAPMVAWRVLTGTWLADFWEHAAVIGELANHPTSPLHPMLAVDAPHALESPYHLLLAIVSRVSGLSAVTVLGWAALVNFAVLCVTFRAFVRLFTRQAMAPFLGLLFTLVLWGPEPWDWSGFYHLHSFSNVMAYPSTFATAAAFASVWTSRAFLLSGGARWAVATGVLAWLVALIHPATFVYAGIGAGALVIATWRPRLARRAAGVLASFGAGTVVALAWPYFPITGLPGADAAGYLRDNDPLLALSGAALKTFPALVGLPFLVVRFIRRHRDPLVIILVGAAAAYLVARLGTIGSLAPNIRFAVLALHIGAADGIVRLLASTPRPWRLRASGLVVAVAFVVAISWTTTATGRTAAGLTASIPDLAFLASDVPDDAVVMTDSITALEVPAWGPKVVAWHYAMPFVDDREARRAAVDAYFAAATTPDERRQIISDWCVEWILIVPERLERAGGASIEDLALGGALELHERATLVQAPAGSGCPNPPG